MTCYIYEPVLRTGWIGVDILYYTISQDAGMTLNELTCEMMFNSCLATVKGTTVFVMQSDIAACQK